MTFRVLLFAGCLATICCFNVAADDAVLTTTTSLQFASPTEGAAHLAKQDRFLDALSKFDCQARLKTDQEVTAKDVGAFAAKQVLAWTTEEEARMRAAIAAVNERMKPFDLPFPAKIVLVKTNGKEEGNAAYCRRNVIIFPIDKMDQRPAALQRLLIHELFHVLSSHNPELRSMLYAIVGFQTCQPIEMPETLQHRKLTNPDAPQLDAYIKLIVDGKAITAVPILYASAESYDLKRGGTFFDYLTFRLLAIEPVKDTWRAVLDDGKPKMFDPSSTNSYLEQIGKNTRYIIHPDEILADNFVHLINGTKDLPTPDIIASLRAKLAR